MLFANRIFCTRFTSEHFAKALLVLIIVCTTVYYILTLLLTEGLAAQTNFYVPILRNYTPSSLPAHSGDEPSSGRNSSRSACVFPKLQLNDTNIMKFFKKYPRLKCNAEPDWLVIENGTFIITSVAYSKHPGIRCDAYPILKVTDFLTREGDRIEDVKNGTQIFNDFYRVHCSSSDKSEYRNYLAGINPNPDALKRRRVASAHGLDLDVIILGLDSTSRLAWHRHLPLSTKYFLDVLNGTEMEGYNILGDGTPAALMPILLDHLEEELHEARRNYQGSTDVDDFPWIFSDFKEAGYVVAWAEDDARLGTFQYRLRGFQNQPTDHYFRYFCLAAEPHYKEFQRHCQGSRPRHSVVLDYISQMFTMYPQQRRWIFSFQSQLSHQDNNYLSLMDEDLLEHLQKLHREKRLENALLILMADHGGRFSKVRATAQGKQEERLPYFSLRFPEWFHQKYPEVIKNINTNSKRLTTPFDVHETLKEILNFTGTGRANISNRGVSMFKEIPLERDCERAHIDPHWCSCLDWKKEYPSSDIISQAVSMILSTFNSYTSSYRNICSVLVLDKVISASSLKVNDAVLKFKDTNDGGRGRFGLMTDNTPVSTVLYQVTLLTHPGSGLFEVTISYDVQKKVFTLTSKDISRTNKYGNSSWCVEKTEPFLRPFCFCNDLLGAE